MRISAVTLLQEVSHDICHVMPSLKSIKCPSHMYYWHFVSIPSWYHTSTTTPCHWWMTTMDDGWCPNDMYHTRLVLWSDLICLDPVGSHQICLDPLQSPSYLLRFIRSACILSDLIRSAWILFRSHQISSDHIRSAWILLRSHQICLDPVRPAWILFRYHQISLDLL
jgi:hypothetical protein